MDGTLTQMRRMLSSWGRGRFVFTDDFASLESHGSVRKGLCQMVSEGVLHRLARGIYYYAGVSGDINIKTSYVLPSEETIAYTVAERERIRIIPYGDQAAKKLGITGMSISMLKYLTDGAPRVINLAKGRKIYFNHTSEVKMFDFNNYRFSNIRLDGSYNKGLIEGILFVIIVVLTVAFHLVTVIVVGVIHGFHNFYFGLVFS